MKSFEALRFHRLGNPTDVLQVDVLEVPPLAPDEVRIRVAAFALNRADWLFTQGWHYSLPNLPSRIGSECSGVVIDVGDAVDRSLVGRKICTVPFDNNSYGVQGELAIIPARYLAPWPSSLSAEEAAASWMQYLTAYFALIGIARVGTGDVVLIPAASSSAGLAAIQLARRQGATVLATTRSEAKVSAIAAMGADHVLVTAEGLKVDEEIRRLTSGTGVRVVFDPIAGSFVNSYQGALARGAHIFLYGGLSGEETTLDLVPLVRSQVVIHPYSMFNHVDDDRALKAAIGYIEAAIDDGMRPIVDTVIPWRNVVKAYERLDGSAHIGKIVVSMQD